MIIGQRYVGAPGKMCGAFTIKSFRTHENEENGEKVLYEMVVYEYEFPVVYPVGLPYDGNFYVLQKNLIQEMIDEGTLILEVSE